MAELERFGLVDISRTTPGPERIHAKCFELWPYDFGLPATDPLLPR